MYISELIEQICLKNNENKSKSSENVVLVLDVSGSTSQIIYDKKSVLTREVEIMTNYILSNPKNNYELYSFDSYPKYYGKIKILEDEDFVDLPNFKPESLTNTCSALKMVVNNIHNFKPNKIVIFTDGQTDNNKNDFLPLVNKFKSIGAKLDIIAISCSNKNMETITSNEEKCIPGMDIVNMLGNSINTLTIYNIYHKDIPFNGITNSTIDKNSIYFFGIKVEGFIIDFINKLLGEIEINKNNIDWGIGQRDFKKMLSEIGKLLSILFIQFPTVHPFLEKIYNQINSSISTSTTQFEMNIDRISKIIEYGFNCSKQDIPVIMTNFEEHLKESTIKHNEFADAIELLKKKGTTLGKSRKISIPYGKHQICIIDSGSVELVKPLDEFVNSIDKFGNVYFAIDGNEQAIRIGMRKFCEIIGFPNARMSPSVIFYILNLMSLMYLSGIDLNNEHMKELRKIAKIQTSMEVMVQQGKYDGNGCWSHWKNGKLIPMHYSKTNTHTSLYSDSLINPLGLSEPLWWALMMSMLGLFDEQKQYYIKILEQMDIGTNMDDFLNWFSNTYSKSLDGNVVLEKITEEQKSIYTLDYFEDTDEIFELNDHSNCRVKTWYSKEEIELYVMNQGCVWCKYIPLSTDFVKVCKTCWSNKIKDSMTKGKQFTLTNLNTVFNSFSEMDLGCEPKRYRINLIGITGSGKTTTSEKIIKLIENKGGKVLVVSADKWSKQNYKGHQLQNQILNEIEEFDSKPYKLKVIVMDLCNENGVDKYSFGFNFNNYQDINFYPNLVVDKFNKIDKFDEYECWCLNNVLSRPLHNSDTNYWLNPVSAGVETCIKVHNSKALGVAKLLGVKKTNNFNQKLNKETILNQIKSRSNNYKKILNGQNLDLQINKLIDDNIQM